MMKNVSRDHVKIEIIKRREYDNWKMKENSSLTTIFSIDEETFASTVQGYTKDDLIVELSSNIAETLNDKNSGRLRERATLEIIGMRQSLDKLGYDSTEGNYEVKPQNVYSKMLRIKLNGGGNITDFTWKRHKKYIDDDVKILSSGFVDGKIVYVIEFDYKTIQQHIEQQLKKHFPDGDTQGKYLRSARFNYSHYSHGCRKLYVSNKIDRYKDMIVGKLYDYLQNK